MAVHQYKVYHFHELVETVECIASSKKIEDNVPPILWARGHRETTWNLRPTLPRYVALNELKGISNASARAFEEEMRKEHYIAKNYHFIQKEPRTSLEWMEVMQHHGVKTRVLDWSESILHSLIFALECFFDNSKFRVEDRIDSSPCLWLLEPSGWNVSAINLILDNDDLINSCIEALPTASRIKKQSVKQRILQIKQQLDTYMGMESAQHLKGIFNLSSLTSELKELQTMDLLYLLEHGELYYCLAYVLVQMYMNTKTRKVNQVMPLSIVEAYHSERIKAQIGAFTIFPYYEEDDRYQNALQAGILLDAMENMNRGNTYLHQILLCNPDEIAYEVMANGMNVSWLYPEMPIVANAIEARKIYL